MCALFVAMPGKFKAMLVETMKNTKKIGEDDPRRIVHSIKVGLALTLVSLFYYYRPLYDSFGQAGMWAVLTVVVVFEYTVGGTICKSLNRAGATLLAGALGVGAEYLARLCGEKGEPFVLGLLVFLLAAVSTFTRFFPGVKKRYDYGVMIFILTFSLVAVSGSQVTQILQLAHQRLSTILVGVATCMVISISICPVWAGEDLSNLVAGNIEKLAVFLDGFGGEFCSSPGDERCVLSSKDNKDKSYLQGYKSVLNSKATEESLANLARWEPRHGRFRLRHPWKQYLKIGALARECACLMETLNGCINSKHKLPPSFSQLKIQPACLKMCAESSSALNELSSAIKSMTTIPLPDTKIHVQNSKSAADDFKTLLAETDLRETMPLLVAASVLIDIINCAESILVCVDELSKEAGFEGPNPTPSPGKHQHLLHNGIVTPVVDHVVGEISETTGAPLENKKLPRENNYSGKPVGGIGDCCICDSIMIEICGTTSENKNPLRNESDYIVKIWENDQLL